MSQLSSEQTAAPPGQETRAQGVWRVVVQLAVLALVVLALVWSPEPKPLHQMLVLLLAVASLVVALVPRWRTGEAAAALCGVALALCCWFTADEKLWEPAFITGYVPLLAPILAAVTVALAIWGAIARAGALGVWTFGKGALAALLLLAGTGKLFYAVINYVPYFKKLYAIERYQLEELLAAVILYPLALWLGGVAIRPARRWTFLPFGIALALAAFVVYWKIGGTP
ncbi:MAG: hypothetical protein ACYC7E_14470 [Armatimonadota bacterium]